MSGRDPWKNRPTWVKVPGRSDVGEVLGDSKPIGIRVAGPDTEESVSGYQVRFDATGEIITYDIERVTRCDADGNDKQNKPVTP